LAKTKTVKEVKKVQDIQAQEKWFQERINKDPYLAIQTALDPLGMLAKFGLVELDDNDVSVIVEKGTLLDLLHLREAVAARGLRTLVEGSAAKPAAKSVHVVIDIHIKTKKRVIHIHIEFDLS
jgi:hypothetical protein